MTEVNESWRKEDVENNKWAGVKKRADKATKTTRDILKNPLSVFRKVKYSK